MDINTTLLREKFIIRDHDREGEAPIVAVSNRLVLALMTDQGHESEVFVIRTQNMHSCVRIAALILQSFMRTGPLLVRAEPFDFEDAWQSSCSDYETAYNFARWIAIYSKGREIYAHGARHPFFDVIEKCDAINPGNYDRAVSLAESSFNKMGKKVTITYEANIGMVVNVKKNVGRCGLIYRGPEKNATFNFMADSKGAERVSPVMCLNVCAAFLEGLQLAYKVGLSNDKIRLLLIDKASSEAREAQSALHRLGELNIEVRGFENRLDVHFRPEKPEFSQMVIEAERHHRRLYEARQNGQSGQSGLSS